MGGRHVPITDDREADESEAGGVSGDQRDLFGDIPKLRPCPEWFHIGKWTPATHVNRVILHGRHPMGQDLGPEISRCGSCSHMYERKVGRTFKKCDLVRETCGAASDIKLRWRGCVRWEPS